MDEDHDDDSMSETERAKLHAALQRSIEQCERGETVPADEVFRELRAKRAARDHEECARSEKTDNL